MLVYQRWIRYWNMSTRQLNIGSKPLLPLAARLITNYKLLINRIGTDDPLCCNTPAGSVTLRHKTPATARLRSYRVG